MAAATLALLLTAKLAEGMVRLTLAVAVAVTESPSKGWPLTVTTLTIGPGKSTAWVAYCLLAVVNAPGPSVVNAGVMAPKRLSVTESDVTVSVPVLVMRY